MLKDLNDGLNNLADRLSATQTETSERLRGTVSQDLKQTRDAMLVLQLSQTEELSANSRDDESRGLATSAADMQMQARRTARRAARPACWSAWPSRRARIRS